MIKKWKKAAKSHVTVHQKTIKMAKLCVRVSRDFDRKEMQKNFSKAQNKMAAKKITWCWNRTIKTCQKYRKYHVIKKNWMEHKIYFLWWFKKKKNFGKPLIFKSAKIYRMSHFKKDLYFLEQKVVLCLLKIPRNAINFKTPCTLQEYNKTIISTLVR